MLKYIDKRMVWGENRMEKKERKTKLTWQVENGDWEVEEQDRIRGD